MGDSYVWRRMLVSFKAASRDLCDTEARVARRIATEHVDPAGPLFLLNNRLIRLDKDPRVRPVGIGEVLQRIIGKSVLKMSKTQRFAFCFTQWERALKPRLAECGMFLAISGKTFFGSAFF